MRIEGGAIMAGCEKMRSSFFVVVFSLAVRVGFGLSHDWGLAGNTTLTGRGVASDGFYEKYEHFLCENSKSCPQLDHALSTFVPRALVELARTFCFDLKFDFW
jgi:hypothetical protein